MVERRTQHTTKIVRKAQRQAGTSDRRHTEYIKEKKIFKQLVQKAKQDSWHNFCSENRTDKEVANLIKKLRNKNYSILYGNFYSE